MPEKKAKLVYSTDNIISHPKKQLDDNDRQKLTSAHQKIIVRLDRKQRGGKSVTIIEGLGISKKEREALLKQLKTSLGTGGTVKDSSLEIQGEHCNAIITALAKMGYRPKRSGG